MRSVSLQWAADSCRKLGQQVRTQATAAEQILAACILERPQVILPDPPAWEVDYQEWKSGWEPAPRTTSADTSNDRRSLRRRLEARLFLFIKMQGSETWGFPQQQHIGEEGIADTARRAIEGVIGEKPQVFFFGRAPHAHLQQENGLLFIHRAQLIQGRPALLPGSSISDHLWLAKDEVHEVMPEGPYADILAKLL
ncbi:hypothetical protein WJX74_010353 [Apatococcus lobatus]|uniref:Ribosomal protein L46 N-terminal domain-containing protein n=1 Tax=Apatococcus lobatus TaxID=904363 RepID=A0AAW1REC3_9CHLO